MKKLVCDYSKAPELLVLGEGGQTDGWTYRLCSLSLLGQEYYLLFQDGNDIHSLSYISPKNAQNMLQAGFQKTCDGKDWLTKKKFRIY